DDEWLGNDYFLLVDGGGNDTYLGDIAVNATLYHPVAALLDLAGNDHYVPIHDFAVAGDPDPDAPAITAGPNQQSVQAVTFVLPSDTGRGTGQAAAWFGVAIIDDAAGDDLYRAPYYQASSMFGVSVLVDHAGNDQYQGYHHSQGSADFGFALLADL